MKAFRKNFIRYVSLVLVLAMLPIWNTLPHVAKAETTSVAAPAVLENTMLHQSQTVNGDLLIRGEVTLADGAQILIEKGTVTIAEGALLRGNVTLNGETAKLYIGGTVEGDVTSLGSLSLVDLGGKIKGTLTIGSHGERIFNEQLTRLQAHPSAAVEKLVLDGGGAAFVRGRVDTVDIAAGNKTCLQMENVRAKTMTVRSDAWTKLMGNTTVDEIFFYGDECTWEEHGYVASLCIFNDTKVGTIHAYDGFFDQTDKAHVDKIFVHGRDVKYHLEIYETTQATPTVDELYVFGSQSNMMTRGDIGFCYLGDGLLQNHGHIGTLVMADGELWSEVGGVVSQDHYYCDITDRFTHLYDQFIQLGGNADLRNDIPVKQAVLLGGWVKQSRLMGDLPILRPGSKSLHQKKNLEEGQQKVASGDVLTMKVPAYSALNLNLTGEGGVLVEEPGNHYTWVEGNKETTILTKQTGTVNLTVLGEGELSLDAALENAVEVKVNLSYRYAAAKKETPRTESLSLSDRKLTLKNEDGKTIDTILTESALYALPETAHPGEKLTLQIDGGTTVPLTLNDKRQAEVSYEFVEAGRYEGTPENEARAHLYLYDSKGDFMQEVFFSDGSYNTGALAEGTYNALWIRGGIGGWMLPRLSDFEENGLRKGKHYTLETIKIRPGNVLRSSPDIPAEPALQSPWLKAEGSSYSTALSTVTAGGLVMMTLQWDFSGSEWTEAVAQLEFPAGGQYVKDSAVFGSGKAEVTWKNKALQVPLRETSGILRFYMEAPEGQKDIISSAFVLFGSESPVAQYVGSTRTVIAPLSIQAPSLTVGQDLVVSGFSLPFSVVGVYDNDRLTAWVTTDGNGWWRSQITLSSETDHVLTVRSEDGQAISDPVNVKIADGAPVLKRFTIDYIEHKIAKKVVLDGKQFGVEPLRFAYEPDTDVTFTIELKNDDTLEALTLVAEQNGHQEHMKATRTDEGKWVIVSPMSKDRAFTPDWLYLEYTFRKDALDSVFTRTYADVPVLETLDYHADLDGILTRYYPADPYFHDVDVGFGAGWVTDYTVRAEVMQNKNQAVARIYTPTGERWFTGLDVSMAEAAGFATAKIHKGTLLVTESDGTKLSFSKNGWLKSVEDPYGEKMELSYQGDFLQKITVGDEVLKLNYDETGHVVSAQCGDFLAEYTYVNGCLTKVQEGENSVHYSYTSGGMPLLTGFQGSHQGNGSVRYDNQCRPVMLTLEGETTLLSYGENTLEMTVADGTVTYTLEDGAVTGITTSDGSSMTTEASEDGVTMKMLDGGKVLYQMEFDKHGSLLSEADETSVIHYGYDDRGNMTSVTDAAGKVTAYAYDKANNLTSITYADGTKETWSYDKKGNVSAFTDRAGHKTGYSYDDQGNLTAVRNPDGTEIIRNWGTGDDGGTWIDLDLGENHTNIYRNQYGTNYNFADHNFRTGNEDYRVIGMDEHNAVTQYSGKRMTGVDIEGGDRLTAYTYDNAGRIISETRGNGTVTRYSYDSNNNLTKLENLSADGKMLSSYTMTHDEWGNVVTMETAEGKWEYAYDAAFRLTSSVSPDGVKTAYAYDKAGNRISITVDGKKTAYKVNELDQIVSAGNAQFTYDEAGNLLSDGDNTYTWNELGQLVEVTDGKNTTSYTYDLYGNRQTRTVNGETTTYHTMPSDLSLVLGQTDKYGETIYYYGSNGLVASEINGELVYYLYDPFGSVSEIVDQNGNVLCSFRYDEWGKVISEEITSGNLAEAAAAQNLRRDGRYGLTDEGNGLIYARARYISTDTGVFISPDPAGQTYDLNLYRYADNNPVMYMDINGEVSINSGGSHSNPFNNNPNPQNPNTYTPKAEQPPRNIFDFSDELPGDKFTKQDTVSDEQKLIEKYRKLYKEEQRLKTNIKARQWFIKNIKPLLKVALLWLGGLIVKGLIALATLLGISLLKLLIILGIIFVIILIIILFAPKAHADDEPHLPKPNDNPGDNDEEKWEGPGTPGKVEVDPSGYVYEAVASNRLSGVTATVYHRSEDGTAIKWDAAEYDQINPQITDFLGQYAWYVPEGMWRVTYSLPGYENTQTAWLPVPPPQTEVNIGMVSRQEPTVTHAARFTDGIELTFSKYMDMDSVCADITALDQDGKSIPVTVTPMNAEKMVDEEREVASRFLVTCQGQAVKLSLAGKSVSYAGTPIAAVTLEPGNAYRLEGLGLQAEYTLTADQPHTLKMELTGEGNYETMAFTTEIMGGSCVKNISISVPDKNGTAELMLDTTDPGRATLRITEKNSGYAYTVQLVVVPAEKQ